MVDHVEVGQMGGVLTRWLSQLRTGNRFNRAATLLVSIILVSLLVALVVDSVQLVSIRVTDWRGAHGHYPTGHLTYTVPERWDTTTLTDLNPASTDVWWAVFDDQVTAVSPSYSACFTDEQCAKSPPDGARIALESASGRSLPTIEAWYQALAEATARRFGPGILLPLADYTRVPLGGQTALCAASQAGSQMLPLHPPPSPHFDTTFAGYTPPYVGQAVVMCFALWQNRAYYLEVTVDLHTASQDNDLRDASRLIESLRFT
ncbi:MAG TPA: hypothetical protein VKT52_11580 [Ktedonobacterales bacterium]|nr:hypothetical protein [Ktedonobacterales bacterium]